MVDQQRKLLPRIGTRKIYYLIKGDLRRQQLKCGRDQLFALMRLYGLQVKPRRRYVQTTMSKHYLRKWPNMIKGMKASECNTIWVSDITYLKTEEGNCYLNMVTDACSRKIVGYAVADTMEAESMIGALKMALAQRPNKNRQIIHHSDRGIQYCGKEYELVSSKNNVRLSMTENGDPYENALAERMNRTIKEEFGMDKVLKTRKEAKELAAQGIFLYIQKRPHLALQMQTPNQVHQTKIPAT